MSRAENIIDKYPKPQVEAVDVGSMIKELIDAKPSDDNKEQGKIVQLLKGLAFSDDPKSTEFMKKLTSTISMDAFGSLIESDDDDSEDGDESDEEK